MSPDSVQGMEPYTYVGGNPETRIDPTGQRWISPDGSQTAWIDLGPANTATIVISAAYGGMHGYAHTKIDLLQTYTANSKGADPGLRNYVKQQTSDSYVKGRVNSVIGMTEGLK